MNHNSLNYRNISALCKALTMIQGHTDTARWTTYHSLAFQLYAELARSPFILASIAEAAYRVTAPEGVTAPPCAQLEWEEMEDDEAAAAAAILAACAFTPSNILAIHAASGHTLATLSAAAKKITASGVAFSDAEGKMYVSPIGKQVAAYFEENRHAIRPPHSVREPNRRRNA